MRKGRLFPNESPMSEAFITSSFLALSGGFMDAYTFFVRDHVFANAQTGNIVQMSAQLFFGNFHGAMPYLVSMLAFMAGILLSESIRMRQKESPGHRIHWRQYVLLGEILILFLVGFMPAEENTIANLLVSFAAAMQVQSFRKVRGCSYVSTMCTGNLRSGTDALQRFLFEKEPGKKRKSLRAALYYYGIIMMFAIGAGIGGRLSVWIGFRAIWISCGLLLVSFLLIFRDHI